MTIIESKNQSGGITAHTVNIEKQHVIPNAKNVKRLSLRSWIPYLMLILAILTYLGLKPKEARMDSRDKQSESISITSYNQSGGITAHTVNLGVPERHLSEDVRNQLNEHFSKHKGKAIAINAIAGDSEAFQFALEVKTYLNSLGYETSDVGQAFYIPFKGQKVKETTSGNFEVMIGNR